MANLLPPDIQSRIQKHFQLRVGIVLLFLAASAWFVALIFLVPTYVLVEGREEALQGLMDAYLPNSEGRKSDPSVILKETKEQIEMLSSDSSELSIPYDVVETILRSKSEGVLLTRYVYTRQEPGPEGSEGTLRLQGVALDRSSLRTSVDRWREEDLFLEIDDPYSNYVESSDLRFSLTLYLNKNHD